MSPLDFYFLYFNRCVWNWLLKNLFPCRKNYLLFELGMLNHVHRRKIRKSHIHIDFLSIWRDRLWFHSHQILSRFFISVMAIWYGPYGKAHMTWPISYCPFKMEPFSLRIMWYETNPKVPVSKQNGETSVPSLSKINSAWYESWAWPSSIVRFFGFKILECIKSKTVSFKRRSFWSDWTQEYPFGSFTNQKPKNTPFPYQPINSTIFIFVLFCTYEQWCGSTYFCGVNLANSLTAFPILSPEVLD